MTSKKIFLSYSTIDRKFADKLRERLAGLGVSVDDPAISPGGGDSWVEFVRQNIAAADAVLAIIPETGRGTANNVLFEIGAAHALGKQILAVVPEEAPGEGRRELPSDLMGMIVLDAEDKSVDAVAETLASTLAAA